MKKLLIATKNPAKFNDIKSALNDLHLEFINLNDIGIKENVSETGKTFEENAKKKALFYAKKSGLLTLADDGGIEIDALNGDPGVKTRRWIDGKQSSDEQLIKYTIIRMKRYKDRSAQLRAVLCLATPKGKTYQVEGKIKGVIAQKPYKSFKQGFPFDALLYFPDKRKYYYQLKYEEKNPINHRSIALQKIKPILKTITSKEPIRFASLAKRVTLEVADLPVEASAQAG
ncbi:non-canonical purine NTP pyrophosphatase [Candidatus Gottesmanbacteria bacterium]|nr:non-canonical purine NTP pyrophosphatase [Candidatus Gottesmanbacteria bacterium]